MIKKHGKLTPSKFLQNAWRDCADAMTGHFSAYFLVGGTVVAYFWVTHLNFTWPLLIAAVIYSAYKQVEKERNNVIALEEKFENREVRQAALKKLWNLRESGSLVRNKANEVTSKEAWDVWQEEYTQWRTDFLRETEIVSVNLKNWNYVVQTMDKSKMPPFTAPYNTNGLFFSNYMIICENLNRLDRYLMNEIFLEQQQYYVTQSDAPHD